MHAWAEVEHDLIYKPGDVALSEDVHAILDQINGMMIAGESALAQLQKAIDAQTSQSKNPFVDHYELAIYLWRAIKPSFPGSASTVIMGRVDLLFRFLQLAELDRPDSLTEFVADLNHDTDTASVVEQIVDRMIQKRQELEEEYNQAREEAGVRNPYSSTSERLSKPNEAEAYGNFLLKWSAFENLVMLLARAKGYDISAMGPSQVVDRLQKLDIVDAEMLARINAIHKLRNKAVHGPAPVDLTELNQSTKFLDQLMLASQFRAMDDVEDLTEQANAASSTDALTGLGNRRAFGLRVMHEFARDPQQALSLLIVDLDNFKVINDTYGHITGDEVLKAIAGVLRANTRSTDVIARYGGDEVYALLPSTNKEQAMAIAEQYRQMVEAMAVAIEGFPLLTSITVSIGVSTVTPAATNWQRFFHKANEALYRAKQEGGNRVFHSSDVS